MTTITLDRSIGYATAMLRGSNGRSVLMHSDWDALGLAQVFGWRPRPATQPRDARGRWVRCDHAGTDGSVQCLGCGATSDEFIASALAYLDAHDGATIEDPGYLGEHY